MKPVRLLSTPAELAAWRRLDPSRPLHFVPTMGALHRGHASLLVWAARPRSGSARPRVLLSVFVNPLQFGPQEDYARYPRDLEADAALAAQAGADALFAPAVADLYPGGEELLTRVLAPPALAGPLCGRSRPGHFDGVATVVCRLLALVRPQRLLLGEKDWQQLLVLRRVIHDLGLPVTVEGCPTVREADGLACSSRLSYLSPAERLQAAALPRALAAAAALHRSGEGNAAALVAALQQHLAAAGLAMEYGELVHPQRLTPLREAGPCSLLAVAARCGATRLIDHVVLMSRSPIVAIDGPAGAGKSTVTRAFARRLGLLYLDTGSMYRALTWWVREQGVDPADAAAVAPLLEDLDLRLLGGEGGEQQVFLNGHDVTTAIRSPEVTALVSTVAAHACVREALTAQQRAMGQRGGLVAEGRDIGTAVFPDAECKVFLTATVAERARRRALDLAERGFAVPPLSELEESIAERDRLDSSRAVAPLLQAEDATELVTDGLSIEEVIGALEDLFRERVGVDAWPGPEGLPGG
jgi:pantoate ligase/cytidylate kinase